MNRERDGDGDGTRGGGTLMLPCVGGECAGMPCSAAYLAGEPALGTVESTTGAGSGCLPGFGLP